MAIKYLASPVKLTWNNFQPVDFIKNNLDAHTNTDLKFVPAIIKPVKQNNKFIVPPDLLLSLTPSGLKKKNGAKLTAYLLNHEQGHYDIAILNARVFTNTLAALSASSEKLLGEEINKSNAIRIQRLDALHKLYDQETNHSHNTAAQAVWNRQISYSLSLPNVTRLCGLDL